MSNPVRIKGLDGLNAKLKQLAPAVGGKTMRQALRAGAKLIEREAKSRVPRGGTGNLKRALTTKVSTSKSGRPRATVGANMPDGAHIALVEFGTSNRVTTGKGKVPAGISRGSTVAKPFLRPAFDSRIEAALSRVVGELDRAIAKVTR